MKPSELIKKELAKYIAEFIKYELEEPHIAAAVKDIDGDMILRAIDAFNGGAR